MTHKTISDTHHKIKLITAELVAQIIEFQIAIENVVNKYILSQQQKKEEYYIVYFFKHILENIAIYSLKIYKYFTNIYAV